MPDSIPTAMHHPATPFDRIIAHPESAVPAVASSGSGAALIVDAFTPGWSASLVVAPLPSWLLLLVGTFMLVGAVFCLVGLLWPLPRRDTAWMVERVGWWLVGSSHAALAVTAAYSAATVILAPLAFASFTVAAGLRIAALHRVERVARDLIDAHDCR